jgi:hypothetical protein
VTTRWAVTTWSAWPQAELTTATGTSKLPSRMLAGTRLALPVATVTTVADHSPRPPRNMPSHGLLVPPGALGGRRDRLWHGLGHGIVLVLPQGSRHDRPLSSPPAAISAGSRLESEAAGYLSSPATRLMVVARMTAPSRYDSSAWRSAAARNAEVCSAVSDTWKVIPTVKAR